MKNSTMLLVFALTCLIAHLVLFIIFKALQDTMLLMFAVFITGHFVCLSIKEK